MPDDIKSAFDRSLESISVPHHSVDVARTRGRRIRATRMAVGISTAVAVGVLGVIGARTVAFDDGVNTPIQPVESPASDVDQLALGLIEDLRPDLCRGYDFYFKSGEGEELHRPVQCGAESKMDLVKMKKNPPSPPRLRRDSLRIVRGPQIVIYAFASNEAKRTWIESHPPFWGGRIAGDRWLIEIMDHASYRVVRDALDDHRWTVLREPEEIWQLGYHSFGVPAPRFEPGMSLARVSRGLPSVRQELLFAQLGFYTNWETTGADRVLAWMLTFRQCIQGFGSMRVSDECTIDRRYVFIDASSGEEITSFTL